MYLRLLVHVFIHPSIRLCIGVAGVVWQCLWRCHAAEHNHSSKFRATWRIHELDSTTSGHHSSHHIAKSLGRLARRTTRGGSVSYATKKSAWPARQASKGSLMDAGHVSMAGCAELGSHAAASAGDTLDIDEPVSPYPTPSGGIQRLHILDTLASSLW